MASAAVVQAIRPATIGKSVFAHETG